MTLATHEEVIEPEIVRTFSEHVAIVTERHESFKFHKDKAVEAAIMTGQGLIAAKADVSHGEWQRFLETVNMSQPYASQFMQIGAKLNHCNCNDLPTSTRALYELSRLEPEDIETGIESGAIHPGMKIEQAKEYARSDSPEDYAERMRKADATRQRLIDEGVLSKPPTDEDIQAEAQRVAQGLMSKQNGNEPLTPEDKFAKALNAVGAAIRINHGVNEAALNEDGWNVLRALGLR